MPRNGSGTMAVLNSFSPNTTAESAKINQNFADAASETTNSLPRDGQAGMTGPFKAANGTSSAPGMTFGSDPDTGFFRKTGNVIGISCGGVEIGSFDASGLIDALGVRVNGIPTGAWMGWDALNAPTGWVRKNGKTIGTVASLATERANADTENLYTFVWTNFADTECPVTGGRGASAAADFAANKPIALPDWRGRAPFGLDTMGNTAAGRLTSTVIADATINGKSLGADKVTLARANLPNTSVVVDIHDPEHGHDVTGGTIAGTTSASFSAGGSNLTPTSRDTIAIASSATGITADFNLNGNVTQTDVNKMPPGVLTTFIIKL